MTLITFGCFNDSFTFVEAHSKFPSTKPNPREKAIIGLANSSLWYTTNFIILIPFLMVAMQLKCMTRFVKNMHKLSPNSFLYLIFLSSYIQIKTQSSTQMAIIKKDSKKQSAQSELSSLCFFLYLVRMAQKVPEKKSRCMKSS